MSDLTKCPEVGCGWSVRDADENIRDIAVNAHLKSHKRLPDGPKVSRRREKNGWADTVADVGGDVVEGAVGALGKLFD